MGYWHFIHYNIYHKKRYMNFSSYNFQLHLAVKNAAVNRSTQGPSVEIKMTHSSPQLSFSNLGHLSRAGHSAVFLLAWHYCNHPCSLLRSWSCTLSHTKMQSGLSWSWAAKTYDGVNTEWFKLTCRRRFRQSTEEDAKLKVLSALHAKHTNNMRKELTFLKIVHIQLFCCCFSSNFVGLWIYMYSMN